jgi:hypothetical protein
VLIEVDSYWLPDTSVYRHGHVKTTVAAIALDSDARRLGYFHNTGYHVLTGEDFDGVFRRQRLPDTLFPYVEFVKRDGPALSGTALRKRSRQLLGEHLTRRPKANPASAWKAALPLHFERLAARDMEFFHAWAFNLPRQLGANFEMLATYLNWLDARSFAEAAAAARRIAEQTKAVQFQIARMANRRKFDVKGVALEPIEADYDRVFTTLLAGTA